MTEIRNNRSKDETPNSTAVFADYAHYYDLLYRDKDYAAEAEYVVGLIRKFHPSARSILELGSGTGIHAINWQNGLPVPHRAESKPIDISPIWKEPLRAE
jgi:ubiquinone/menaquinone biosynthesis C-methylase UbiE